MVAFVQSASNSGTNVSTVTVTLGSNTTANNCLITGTQGSDALSNPHVTSITLGGVADHFGVVVGQIGTTSTTAGVLDIWGDPNCAGGQTSVVVNWNTVGTHEEQAFVYEFSGMLNTNTASSLLDQSSTNFTTTTNATFTSNTTPTTTQATELWWGVVGGFQTTITGPSSPWVNSSQLGSTSVRSLMVGYQIVSATGTATYSGSYSPNSFSEAGVAALFAAAGGNPAGTVQPRATVPVPRRKPARAVWAQITGQAFVAVPAPRQEYQLAPRRRLARAVWRGGSGQAYVAVPAPVQQYRLAPRRRLARAYVQFVPVTTTNAAAVAGVAGTVPALMVNQTRVMVRRDGRVVRR